MQKKNISSRLFQLFKLPEIHLNSHDFLSIMRIKEIYLGKYLNQFSRAIGLVNEHEEYNYGNHFDSLSAAIQETLSC